MKRHRVVPIILLILGLPLAALIGFFLVATIATHDEAAPDDAALLLPKVTVADADNAFVEMQTIESSDSFPSETDTKLSESVGLPWDEAYATSMITKHAADIALFKQAAAKPKFQDPTFADPDTFNWDTAELPNYYSYRQVAQVTALEAEQRARGGDVRGALDEAIGIVHFGQTMENSQGALIGYLVASSIKQTGLTAIRQIALASSLTAAQAKETAQALEAYRDSRSGQAITMKMEYAFNKSFLQENYRLGPLLGFLTLTSDLAGNTSQQNSKLGDFLDYSGLAKFYYHPNQTLRYRTELADYAVRNAEADCTWVDVDPPRLFTMQKTSLEWFFTPNAIGKYLTSIGEISIGGLSTKRCNESVAISATQATLGIRAYAVETGNPPANLSDIVPKYLNTIPPDPYDIPPLSYSAPKEFVYSVGPSRQDLGGSLVSSDWQNQDNPSFAISQ
ncbi:MAG: hypothetical protein WCV50_05960 [Patescibacteria group bacterium]|jgi:hypothetical protein